MFSILLLVQLFMAVQPVSGDNIIIARDDWQEIIAGEGLEGCFVLHNPRNNAFMVSDEAQKDMVHLPASTFKIFNSLVALQEGVIKDEHEVFTWNGVDRGYSKWNRDMDMVHAFRYSSVWYYQELARRAGKERMAYWLKKANYGNGQMGAAIDQFWLSGKLAISPVEQVKFLERLYREDLPFDAAHQQTVKGLMLLEEGEGYKLYGKTGWATDVTPYVGWFVGFVEVKGKPHFFAIRLNIVTNEDAKKRIEITKRILREEGLID